MGAYFVLYPRSQVLTAVFLILYLDVIEVPAVIFLGVWLVMQLRRALRRWARVPRTAAWRSAPISPGLPSAS